MIFTVAADVVGGIWQLYSSTTAHIYQRGVINILFSSGLKNNGVGPLPSEPSELYRVITLSSRAEVWRSGSFGNGLVRVPITYILGTRDHFALI